LGAPFCPFGVAAAASPRTEPVRGRAAPAPAGAAAGRDVLVRPLAPADVPAVAVLAALVLRAPLAAGLAELVTQNVADYEALALRLARDPAARDAVRRKLAGAHATAALFDVDRFRRHLEAAYTVMHEIRQRGEGPRSFSVEPVAAT